MARRLTPNSEGGPREICCDVAGARRFRRFSVQRPAPFVGTKPCVRRSGVNAALLWRGLSFRTFPLQNPGSIAPELIAQPARAPRARAVELELGLLRLHGGRVQDGRRAVGGKERARAGLAVVLIEDLAGLLSGGALGVIDLDQIGAVPPHHTAPGVAALHDRSGTMLPAVIVARAGLRKMSQCSEVEGDEKRVGRPYTRLGDANT